MAFRDDSHTGSRPSISYAKGSGRVLQKEPNKVHAKPTLRSKKTHKPYINKENSSDISEKNKQDSVLAEESDVQGGRGQKKEKKVKPSIKSARTVSPETVRARQQSEGSLTTQDGAQEVEDDSWESSSPVYDKESAQAYPDGQSQDAGISGDGNRGSNVLVAESCTDKSLNEMPSENDSPNTLHEEEKNSKFKEDQKFDPSLKEERSPQRKMREKKKMPLFKKVVIFMLFLVVIGGIILGVFSCLRWFSGDDKASFEGAWKVYGTETVLSFTSSDIVLNANTSYAYHIDTFAKTIEYSFGNAQGKGRYWFNKDKTILVITDGKKFDAFSTFCDDFGLWLSSLFRDEKIKIDPQSIVLSRDNIIISPEKIEREQQNDPQTPPVESQQEMPHDQSEDEENRRKPWKDLEIYDVALKNASSDE